MDGFFQKGKITLRDLGTRKLKKKSNRREFNIFYVQHKNVNRRKQNTVTYKTRQKLPND